MTKRNELLWSGRLTKFAKDEKKKKNKKNLANNWAILIVT